MTVQTALKWRCFDVPGAGMASFLVPSFMQIADQRLGSVGATRHQVCVDLERERGISVTKPLRWGVIARTEGLANKVVQDLVDNGKP